MTTYDLRALLAEKNRRDEKNRVYHFQPHDKQKEFFKLLDENDEALFLAGNRVGKSEAGAVYLSKFLIEHPGTLAWCLCPSFSSQKDTTQEKLEYYLPPILTAKNYYYTNGVLAEKILKNGSRVVFHSYEQGREKLQGAGIGIIWFDEEPPWEIYLESRMRQKAGQKMKVILTLTPLIGQEFIKEKSLKSCVKGCWNDNPYLTEEQKSAMREGLSETEIQVREFGNFAVMEGRVIRNLPGISESPIGDNCDLWECIDPGFADPTGYILLGIDNDRNIYVDKIFRKSEMSYQDIQAEVRKARSGRRIYRTLSDNNEPRLLSELSSYGILATPVVKATKFSSWDEYLALKASYFFEKNKISFSKETEPLLDELKNLYWVKKGDQTLPQFDLHRRLGHHFDLTMALFYLLAEIHEKYVEPEVKKKMSLMQDTFHVQDENNTNNFVYQVEE